MSENISYNSDSVDGLLYWKSKKRSCGGFSIGEMIQDNKFL